MPMTGADACIVDTTWKQQPFEKKRKNDLISLDKAVDSGV
jgi:hypothetical protein